MILKWVFLRLLSDELNYWVECVYVVNSGKWKCLSGGVSVVFRAELSA